MAKRRVGSRRIKPPRTIIHRGFSIRPTFSGEFEVSDEPIGTIGNFHTKKTVKAAKVFIDRRIAVGSAGNLQILGE
jgi:hypothetical protein